MNALASHSGKTKDNFNKIHNVLVKTTIYLPKLETDVYTTSALQMNNSNKIQDYVNIRNQCELFAVRCIFTAQNNAVVLGK